MDTRQLLIIIKELLDLFPAPRFQQRQHEQYAGFGGIEFIRGNKPVAVVNDEELYQDIRNLVVRVDNLLADIEENPRKYFKFSVF